MRFTPTRSAALEQFHQFLPKAAEYAALRNFDQGQGKHTQVSQLSPYLRTRLLTEEECSKAVLQTHSYAKSEKFLQEIAWRTYWKGWLEMRPKVWTDYQDFERKPFENHHYFQAISGNTGIDCFDAWIKELTETGYLHNHARMWLASIWIFTLKLPWQLGADFFLKHLLDADAASNTLSWRWVAGLHTPGKHYVARAENISKFTAGRFKPSGKINESPSPLPQDFTYEKKSLNYQELGAFRGKIGHLLLPEDLSPLPPALGKAHAVTGFIPPKLKTTDLVSTFLQGAMNDALERYEGTEIKGDFTESLKNWATQNQLDVILLSQPTIGLSNDFLKNQRIHLPIYHYHHSWDKKLWPHAVSGFFRFKAQLPKIYQSLMS